jgi:putative transposase
MTRLHGWAPKGERLVDKVPQGKWKTATFLAALRSDRIDAPCLFDGPINGERFRAYVDQFLVPTLKPGDVVILDMVLLQRYWLTMRAGGGPAWPLMRRYRTSRR